MSNNIEILTFDCLIHVFTFLPHADRARLRRVCKFWEEVSLQSWSKVKSINLDYKAWNCKITKNGFIKILKLCGQYVSHVDLTFKTPNNLNVFASKSMYKLVRELCPNICSLNADRPYALDAMKYLAENYRNLVYFEAQIDERYEEEAAVLLMKNQSIKAVKFNKGNFVGSFLKKLNPQVLEELHLDEVFVYDMQNVADVMNLCYNLNTITMALRNMDFQHPLQALEHPEKINNLSLSFSLIENTLKQIDYLSEFKNLKKLKLTGIDHELKDVLLSVGDNCQQLKSLAIHHSSCNDIDGLWNVLKLPELEYLYLHNIIGFITDGLSCATNVKVIEICRCSSIHRNRIIELLNNSVVLRSLKIECCEQVTTDWFSAFFKAGNKIKSPKLSLIIDNSLWEKSRFLEDVYSVQKNKDSIIKILKQVPNSCSMKNYNI